MGVSLLFILRKEKEAFKKRATTEPTTKAVNLRKSRREITTIEFKNLIIIIITTTAKVAKLQRKKAKEKKINIQYDIMKSISSTAETTASVVAAAEFTAAVRIGVDALMTNCGYSRERATTTLLKELNRTNCNSGSSISNKSCPNNRCGSPIHNKPTDDEVS